MHFIKSLVNNFWHLKAFLCDGLHYASFWMPRDNLAKLYRWLDEKDTDLNTWLWQIGIRRQLLT